PPRPPSSSRFPYTTLFRSSFGDDRHALMHSAESRLDVRYPNYSKQVAAFIAEDSLRPLRDAVDQLRLQQPQQLPSLLQEARRHRDRKSTRLNSSHVKISYA